MAETLSEKLGLVAAEFSGRAVAHSLARKLSLSADAAHYAAESSLAPFIERDRVRTVEAVARWLEARYGTPAVAIRRELLAPPSPGETWEPLAERERERQGGRIVGDPVAASPGESRELGGSDG